VPDYVGISLYTLLSDGAVDLIKMVRQKWSKTKIILGGKHFNNDVLEIEKDRLIRMADYVVIGEGEYAIEMIINGSADKIVYGTKFMKADFNKLLFPDKYIMIKQCGQYPTGCMFARGCVYNCVFCCDHRAPILVRTPDVAVRHIKNLIEWSGNNRIYIYDDIFSINKKWLYDFRDELKKQKVDARINCFIHGKKFDEEMLELLIECQVIYMDLGAESGDNEILKLIKKKTTVDDYRHIDKIVKKRKNITLHVLWMMCNIGETRETIKKTIRLAKEIGTKKPHFSLAIPFPGTGFWKKVSQYGKIVEHRFGRWSNKTLVFLPKRLEKKEAEKLFKKATGAV
jgi:anaerobic magnesium-protoporphyrin IX monomethyl ester cyclase